MTGAAAFRPLTVPISAVERDTGLSKDTLRAWERRYGFPVPGRDLGGDRAYPLEQVDRLRAIKRLLDSGHKPGRIVALRPEELQRMHEGLSRPAALVAERGGIELHAFVDLLKTHDVQGLRHTLGQAAQHLGLKRFVLDVVAPLDALVGESCMRGQVEAFEERLYVESVCATLRLAIGAAPLPHTRALPRVLLAGFPHEPHGVGLLMAEALVLMGGGHCLPLGPQNPVHSIALAAAALRADVVSLSLGAGQNPNQVVHGLAGLRRELSPETVIWAGGDCPVLHRRPVAGVVVLAGPESVADELLRWQIAHA